MTASIVSSKCLVVCSGDRSVSVVVDRPGSNLNNRASDYSVGCLSQWTTFSTLLRTGIDVSSVRYSVLCKESILLIQPGSHGLPRSEGLLVAEISKTGPLFQSNPEELVLCWVFVRTSFSSSLSTPSWLMRVYRIVLGIYGTLLESRRWTKR